MNPIEKNLPTPQAGDDVRGYGHKYGTRIIALNQGNTHFKITNGDYYPVNESWHPFTEVEFINECWVKKSTKI